MSQVPRLTKAADEMREAIAHLAGLDEDEVQIEVVPILPEGVARDRDPAKERRAEAVRLQDEAAAAHRRAARALSAHGMSVREIGLLLDVSPQSVSQLVKV
ncbi:MAG: hypothetical protein Q4G43_09685 [Mobilicoccus sp.]|nr:hypothetical protein [Mobilicoccus sp.]